VVFRMEMSPNATPRRKPTALRSLSAHLKRTIARAARVATFWLRKDGDRSRTLVGSGQVY
jgi:hypothetical protein